MMSVQVYLALSGHRFAPNNRFGARGTGWPCVALLVVPMTSSGLWHLRPGERKSGLVSQSGDPRSFSIRAMTKETKKLFTLLDLCVSSLRRGHANLLCIVPILTDDPRRESKKEYFLQYWLNSQTAQTEHTAHVAHPAHTAHIDILHKLHILHMLHILHILHISTYCT